MKVFVYKMLLIIEGEILKVLGGIIGDLKIINVVVMNIEKLVIFVFMEGLIIEEIIFEVEIIMLKREFIDDFRDFESELFKMLFIDLILILIKIFEKEVKNFFCIDIIEFCEGSIICIFNVIIE